LPGAHRGVAVVAARHDFMLACCNLAHAA
jgi:hypothetical protein